jgi:class 3 adenylate cyclase/tetratricopeptide (TPR) repeat protein
MDVGTWLRNLGLGRYEQAFRENDIDAVVLADLTAEDLIGLGVTSIGHRRKLLAAIAQLRGGTAPLPVQGASASISQIASPVPGAERRHVTVLFADLAGYTKLAEELDAEEVHALLGRFFDLADASVAEHGGTVDKHIGDCVMAVFGAPVAYGNDPERCVRAALEIQRRMPVLAAELGRPIGVHVGIASGEVVASGTGSARHLEYTVTGESVNLASRLSDEAAPGEILISDSIHRALADRLDCSEVGELAIKGLAKPVRAWHLRAFRDPARSGRQSFVGRRRELRRLKAALAQCRDTGRGRAIYIRGEAGIGKTRVLEHFEAQAEEDDFACHKGLVLDFGMGVGQDAIRSLVRSLLGLSGESTREEIEAAAEKAVEQGLLPAERRVYLNDLLNVPQPTELRTLYDAMDNAARERGNQATVAALAAEASARRPRLLAIEDLHWADRATLDHLANLADTVAQCPALLVMTSRFEGDPLDESWRSRIAGQPIATIDLGPLQPSEAALLAKSYRDRLGELAQRCIERAAGNPLFLEQLLRHAEESSGGGVPGSIRSLVQARLDRLAWPDKQALQAASVLGQRFTIEAVAALLEQSGCDCTALVRHLLVRPEGDHFLFAHALIQEGVYDTLLKRRRRELHRRAAEWFAPRDVVLRAEHLDRAEDPEAPQTYAAAAQAEFSAFHYERALSLAERGLALASAPAEQQQLALLRGELLRELGRTRDAMGVFRQLRSEAIDPVGQSRALIGIGSCVRLLGGFQEGIDALAEAEPLARSIGADREFAQIAYYRGCLLFAAGKIDACLAEHEQAFAYANRAGDAEWQARALSGLGDAQYGKGRMRSAMEHFIECQNLCRRLGLGRIEAGSTHMIGSVRRYLFECREAIADLRSAVEMAVRVGNLRTEMTARTIFGELLLEAGDAKAAYNSFSAALAIAETLGNQRYRALILYEIGRAFWHEADRRAEAQPVLADALALSRETDPSFAGPRIVAALAMAGAPSRFDLLDEGEALLHAGCLAHNTLWFYRDAIEASLDAAAWDRAERYADELELFTSPEPLQWADFFIDRGRALVAWGRGQRTAAIGSEFGRLHGEAVRVGLRMVLPAFPAEPN